MQVQAPATRIYGARASDYMPELPGATPGLPDPLASVDQRAAFGGVIRYQSGDKCVGESLSGGHFLARKGGVGAIFTMPVDAAYEALNSTSPVYTASPGASLGLHCQLVVGYGTFAGQVCVIVRNSWGTGFGDGGYAYIPLSRFKLIATNVVGVLGGPDLGGAWASELGIWTIARAMERDRKTDPIPDVGCMPGDAIAGTIARGVYRRDARDDNPANDTGAITGEEATEAIGHLFTPDNFLPIANADTDTLQQVLTMGAQRMAA